MSKTIFLSGAIENLPDKGRTWRWTAKKELELKGFKVIDPSTYNDDQVVNRNIALQLESDLLLVEFMIPNHTYLGTIFELTMAKVWNQPTIVFAHRSHASRTYLPYLSTDIFSSYEDARDEIINNYNKGGDSTELE